LKILDTLLSTERTIVYPMHEPWLDVGRPADYQSAQDIGSGDFA
jgi:hypothetical protein